MLFKKRVNARLHKHQDLYDDITSLSLHEHRIQNAISVFFQSPLLSLPQCHLNLKQKKLIYTLFLGNRHLGFVKIKRKVIIKLFNSPVSTLSLARQDACPALLLAMQV